MRLACAQPGDQISIFGDALRELSERSAYLYREGDRYWFATQPTLNRIADERAKDVSQDDADGEVIATLKREQSHKGGFHRVHAAPDNPLDVEDARGVALVILGPSYSHAQRTGDTTKAESIASDTVQRRGAGQRRYRNALIFVAADEDGLETCREIARRYIAWRSIVDDEALSAGLTRAQFDDATSRMKQTAEGLAQRVRTTWSHAIFPVSSTAGDGTGAAASFALDHSSVANRAPGKPIAEVVYDKLRSGGVIVDELGPDTLLAELRKVWREDTPHVPVVTLHDWFASYVYLTRLRDDVTLVASIEKLLGKIESPVGFARSFDKAAGTYEGATQWSTALGGAISSGLLVWRSALPVLRSDAPKTADDGEREHPAGGSESRSGDTGNQPRRFYGSLSLDPDRAGLQVAALAKEILIELTRPHGSTVKISLEIEGRAPTGYPEDVVEVVRANLRDLKLNLSDIGFEED